MFILIFRLLERLLKIAVDQTSTATLKEKECLAIACLNLLRLQVSTVIVNPIIYESV